MPAEVFQVDKNYYVFLGAAENLEATKELALLYKTHDIDVYWKEIDFTTKLKKENQEIENFSLPIHHWQSSLRHSLLMVRLMWK